MYGRNHGSHRDDSEYAPADHNTEYEEQARIYSNKLRAEKFKKSELKKEVLEKIDQMISKGITQKPSFITQTGTERDSDLEFLENLYEIRRGMQQNVVRISKQIETYENKFKQKYSS